MRKQRVLSNQSAKILTLLLTEPNRKWIGFEVIKQTKLSSGVVYPTLARLERQRVLSSQWEEVRMSSSSRGRRHLYVLTDNGEVARQLIAEWESHSQKRSGYGRG